MGREDPPKDGLSPHLGVRREMHAQQGMMGADAGIARVPPPVSYAPEGGPGDSRALPHPVHGGDKGAQIRIPQWLHLGGLEPNTLHHRKIERLSVGGFAGEYTLYATVIPRARARNLPLCVE